MSSDDTDRDSPSTEPKESRVHMASFATPNIPIPIPAPEKFVRENITAFLQEYTTYMAAFGRTDEEQLAVMVVYYLDRRVKDEVIRRREYAEKDWHGLTRYLKDHYKWFDKTIGRADFEALVKKKNYNDLHTYLGEFDNITLQLQEMTN